MNREHAESLRRLAAAESLNVDIIDLDVTSVGSVEHAVRSVLERAGRIDVLINNAGIAAAGVSEAFTLEQAQAVFDVNVFGILRTTRAVLPSMRQRCDGLVINVGSILGRLTFPFFGLYGASKFAVEALTEGFRYELSKLGVDVVLVQPSDVGRLGEYGEIGEIPGRLFAHFMQVFQGTNAPKPHDVAEAIADLIAQPKGTRPIRTVVGASFGADVVNAQTALVQRGASRCLASRTSARSPDGAGVSWSHLFAASVRPLVRQLLKRQEGHDVHCRRNCSALL